MHGVGIDTRKLRHRRVVRRAQGRALDGHDHLAEAPRTRRRGCAGDAHASTAICRRCWSTTPSWRWAISPAPCARNAHVRVVGITGSNGKTTVKTLVASILQRHGRTHAMPATSTTRSACRCRCWRCRRTREFAVLEMGAGKPGDIAYLAAIARPEVGLVNNIAPAHLERMGSLEGVAETKGALYQALPADGVAVINADDAFAEFLRRARAARAACCASASTHNADVARGQRSNACARTVALRAQSRRAGDAEVRCRCRVATTSPMRWRRRRSRWRWTCRWRRSSTGLEHARRRRRPPAAARACRRLDA